MNIAKHVITKVGDGSFTEGVRLISTWLKRSRVRVWSWPQPKERGGSGGNIPSKDQLPILLHARAYGRDIRPSDFFGLTDLPPLGTPINDNLICSVATEDAAVGPAAPGGRDS